MKHSALQKQIRDREYERRLDRQGLDAVGLDLLLMLLPLLVFAGLTWWEIGFLPPIAMICAAASYAFLLAVCTWRGRREALAGMRREGLADEGYRPPGA